MRRLYGCAFTAPRDHEWPRLARVLEATAAVHCDAWDRTFQWLSPPAGRAPTEIPAHLHNTVKLDAWAAAVDRSDDGDELLLIDADTAILRPIDDVWAQEFDLAYTVKTTGFPFNLGVLFVRVSPWVREFFSVWRAENARLFAMTYDESRAWRKRFGGINQSSFGLLLERGALSALRLVTLPCALWNCEETGWPQLVTARPRILHIKGALRRALFRGERPSPSIVPAIAAWRALEETAHVAAAT